MGAAALRAIAAAGEDCLLFRVQTAFADQIVIHLRAVDARPRGPLAMDIPGSADRAALCALYPSRKDRQGPSRRHILLSRDALPCPRLLQRLPLPLLLRRGPLPVTRERRAHHIVRRGNGEIHGDRRGLQELEVRGNPARRWIRGGGMEPDAYLQGPRDALAGYAEKKPGRIYCAHQPGRAAL